MTNPSNNLEKSMHQFWQIQTKRKQHSHLQRKIPKQLKPKNYKKNTHNTWLGNGAISGMTHAVAQTQVFEFWTVYTKMYFESILQNNRFWTNYLADRCDFLKNFTTALVIRLSSEDSCSHRICRTCRICRQTGGLPSLQWQDGAISAQKFYILRKPEMASLNSRQEVGNHCRHIAMSLLSNVGKVKVPG